MLRTRHMRGHSVADFWQYNMAVNHIVCSLVLLVSGVLALDIDSEDVAKQVSNSMHVCIYIDNFVKGAYSLPTPFLEIVRMIKYRVSMGCWNICYCDVVSMGGPIHISPLHFNGLPQICRAQVWHYEKNLDISVAIFLVPLFGSVLSGLYRPLMNLCNICIDSAWC